jgi:RNA polymerase sigma-70 factor (ECF subfamily)
MAATVLQPSPVIIRGDCYQSKVQQLTDVITHHLPRFRRIALAHVSNIADAEDAAGCFAVGALTHVHQFRGQAKMSAWLTTIVINSGRMKLSRRLPSVQLTLDEADGLQERAVKHILSDTRLGPEQAYRDREIGETLAHATLRLSPALRRTFQLRNVNGLSIRETADLRGVPTGMIKARLARARMELREMMRTSIRRPDDRRCSRDCQWLTNESRQRMASGQESRLEKTGTLSI